MSSSIGNWRTVIASLLVLSASRSDASRGCDIKSISSGDAGVCVLRNDGVVSCWGDDDLSRSLAQVPAGLYTQVSVGAYHACGIRQDGTAACWGDDDYQPAPEALTGPFRQLSVGSAGACGVRTDGTAVCLSSSATEPVTTLADGIFLDVHVSHGHVCGRREDRTVECWFGNGDGETTAPAGTFAQISVGPRATCGLRDDGHIECWGYGVGTGQFVPPEGIFTQISLHNTASFENPWASAVRQDGAWIFWGEYDYPSGPPTGVFREVSSGGAPYGVRNDGSIESWMEEYFEIKSLQGPFTEVSVGGWTRPLVCGIDIAAGVSCTGGDPYYGLDSPQPGLYRQLAPGQTHGCGLHKDGTVACWGNDIPPGETGAPPGQFQQISSGDVSCGIREGGSVECWVAQGSPGPFLLDVPNGEFVQVAAGGSHACAIATDGHAECWEYDGRIENFAPPEGPFVQLSASGYYYFAPYSITCGLRQDGSIVCWGDDESTRLDVPSGAFVQVSTGLSGSCGLRPNGSIECWGDGEEHAFAPPDGVFTQVAAGAYHACGLETDGSIRCWGYDRVVSFCAIPSPLCGNGTVDAEETCDDGETAYTVGNACTDACAKVPCGQPLHPNAAEPGASDALFALRAAVGIQACDLEVCDVNGNASVSTVDALVVLRVAVGLAATLACPS